MVQRTSKVEQRYGGQNVQAGGTIDVPEKDLRLMLALGRIEPVKGDKGYVAAAQPAAQPIEKDMRAGAGAGYQTREMTAAVDAPQAATPVAIPDPVMPAAPDAPAAPAPPAKRPYQRKAV